MIGRVHTTTDDQSYLGGRFVFGSGSTWPHDFLFLVAFFSGSGVPVVEAAEGEARLVWVRAVRPASMDRSACWSSATELGVNISMGLTVELDAGLVPNSEGYISSGAESKDSAGESSNLMLGDAVRLAQESILLVVWNSVAVATA